jgi:hypothetical protein
VGIQAKKCFFLVRQFSVEQKCREQPQNNEKQCDTTNNVNKILQNPGYRYRTTPNDKKKVKHGRITMNAETLKK